MGRAVASGFSRHTRVPRRHGRCFNRLRQLESPVTHHDGHPESRLWSAAFDFLSKDHIVPDVSQLRRVLTETVARQRSGIISADKLPPECRSVTRRKLTQMEALERDAIVP